MDTPHHIQTVYIISYTFYIGLGLSEHGYTPNPRVKSSRSPKKRLYCKNIRIFRHTNVVGLPMEQKKTKSNPGTRATPMTHRMVGKIWKICRRKLGKQLLGLEPSQEQFSSTTDASSASWSHFDLNCFFILVYFCCKTVVPAWTK